MASETPTVTGVRDLQALLELVNDVFDPRRRQMGPLFPTLFCTSNLDLLRVIEMGGRPVSHVGVKMSDLLLGPVRLRAGCVGAVCTHPDFRGQGLAQAALRDAIQRCREQGVDLFYVSGDRGLYRRHGCAPCGRVERFTVTPAAAAGWREMDLQVLPFRPEHVDQWSRLHQLEPVRFHRPRQDWLALMRPEPPGHWFRGRTSFLTALDRNGALAYTVVFADGERGRVVEIAGARRTVAAALAVAYEELGLKELIWSIPAHDLEAIALCHYAGLEGEAHGNEGTVAILDWPRLGERLQPWLEERLGTAEARDLRFLEDGDNPALGWRGQQITLADQGDPARLLFGSSPGEPEIELPPGPMEELAERAFPLPRPRYGLNYI